MKGYIAVSAALIAILGSTIVRGGDVVISPIKFRIDSGNLVIDAGIGLDSLKLSSDRQIFITPELFDASGESLTLPSILINGRNMHYAFERRSIPRGGKSNHKVGVEARRFNCKSQTLNYTTYVPLEKWMFSDGASIRFLTDTCGCGNQIGEGVITPVPLGLNPAKDMRPSYQTPAITELPISIHEGKARVQFEVDRTELHDTPYVCRNGQRIDNTLQLKVIDDSVKYALTDPNVEIASISICGYASPESPYIHNEMLSTGRSRALAEYLGEKYNLPEGSSRYNAVAENWAGFRDIVENSNEITEKQRADLLALIDKPAYGPTDYDEKERVLKTDPRFSSLYKSLILPKWFPELRTTTFVISTRLKPLADEDLAEVILTTPEKMNLNQMMRVARLYPEGSQAFNKIIEIARDYFPDDETASINAAVALLQKGDTEEAAAILEKCGESPEAENARGILATINGDFEEAKKHFENAAPLPEAAKNLEMLPFEGKEDEGHSENNNQ